MWTVFVGAVLAALSGDSTGEEERKEALGLGRQLDLTLWPSDLLVPVRAWSDGAALFRIIGSSAYAAVEEAIGTKVRPEYPIEEKGLPRDLDASTDPSTVGTDLSAYAYIEGRDPRPTALVLVSGGEASKGTEDEFGGAILNLAFSRELPKGSAVRERLWRVFAEENDLVEHAENDLTSELWGRAGTVKDEAVDLLEALDRAFAAREDTDDVLETVSDASLKKWGELYRDLRWAMKGYEAEHADLEFWEGADPDDPKVRERMSEWMSDDEIEEIFEDEEDENRWGTRSKFDRFREGQIEGVQEQIREMETDVMALADREVSAAEKFLEKVSVGGAVQTGAGADTSWGIRRPWDNSNTEDIDRVQLQTSSNGRLSFDLENGRVQGNPIGLLQTLLSSGLAERESKREEKVGDPSFVFPGELRDVWETYALLGDYRPRYDAPIALFLKIASDHGLLTEAARRRSGKLLLEWEDPMSKMIEHELL